MRLITKEDRLNARAAIVPKDAVLDPRSNEHAAVYIYTRKSPCAIGFVGSAGNPSFHYSYVNEMRREEAINQFFSGIQDHLDLMCLRKLERISFQHTLKVGDILVNSWGYDQTNIDYYQVTAVMGKQVEIRAIDRHSEETGWLQGNCTPAKDKFIGQPMQKLVGKGNAVKIHKWGSWAYPWDGRKDHWTAYA